MSATKVLAPDYVLAQDGIRTQKRWRALKRTQLRKAIKAFADYRKGCAFTPSVNREVGTIDDAFNSLREALSEKNWNAKTHPARTAKGANE